MSSPTSPTLSTSQEPPPQQPSPQQQPPPQQQTPPQQKLPRRRRIIRRRKDHPPQEEEPLPPLLLQSISILPSHYDFEIPKTLSRIKSLRAHHIALQMPEGLLLYATTLADIFTKFSHCTRVSILGDVTYGACCVDDLGAQALGCDLLVHYGHSCLVPMRNTVMKCLYVFVEIQIDVEHLVGCVCETLEEGVEVEVMGTVQFRTAIVRCAKLLTERKRKANVPQVKPLSPGEVLGCTAPSLSSSSQKKVLLFISDGRFHLEAAMIANPNWNALRYDPYSKTLTEERYDVRKMKSLRWDAIQKAQSAKFFGIILGTLGRQGNPAILSQIRQKLASKNKQSFVMLLSEIFPAKLQRMSGVVDAWVQVACPRLSVDWGHSFEKPLLTPYELEVCLGLQDFCHDTDDHYPMDNYKFDGEEWTNYHESNKDRDYKHGDFISIDDTK